MYQVGDEILSLTIIADIVEISTFSTLYNESVSTVTINILTGTSILSLDK